VRRRHIRRRLSETSAEADPAAALRQRVVGAASPEFSAWLERPSRAAAVLLGLVPRPAGLGIVLTERAGHLTDHPGQVSFPGGRIEGSETPEQAALREAQEEIALAPAQVDVLGQLPAQLTGTGFLITPIVGWVDPVFSAKPDPTEVQTVFEVPLAHLLAPENRRRTERTRWNTRFVTDEYRFERFLIWGATAGILRQFLHIIK
jgi:8-oxo-dGTP pyrophosphatase MutT (NUDIX family)